MEVYGRVCCFCYWGNRRQVLVFLLLLLLCCCVVCVVVWIEWKKENGRKEKWFRFVELKARQCVPVVEDVVRRRLLWIGDVVRGGQMGNMTFVYLWWTKVRSFVCLLSFCFFDYFCYFCLKWNSFIVPFPF